MTSPTLDDAIQQFGHDTFLLTTSRNGPHTSHVTIDMQSGAISCPLGGSAAANIVNDQNVTLFWPPTEPGGYALIINGTADTPLEQNGELVTRIKITKSVYHRRAPAAPGSSSPFKPDCRRVRFDS
ncbi:MAG: hypothetical protein ACK5JT_07315 [Hyphomicrobiaceae bacterium]